MEIQDMHAYLPRWPTARGPIKLMQEKSKGRACRFIFSSEGDRAADMQMLIATSLDVPSAGMVMWYNL